MTRAFATPKPDVTPRRTSVLQRACACGEAAGLSGRCPECEAQEQLGIRPKLALNAPGDRYEQEADRIADQVVSGAKGSNPATIAPRAGRSADCGSVSNLEKAGLRRQVEEDEEDELQAKPAGAARCSAGDVARAANAVSSGGRPLSRSERSFFESRLGHDFSKVRIHDDARAGAAARGINARAYTLRNHIAFAPGARNFASTEGRRLMAHELTHTLQQAGGASQHLIQRAPPEAAVPEKEPEPDTLGLFMTYVEDGKTEKIQLSDLTMMEDHELDRLKAYANVKRLRLMEQAKATTYERVRKTFEFDAHKLFVLVNMILNILIRRARAVESTAFKEMADAVRDKVPGDARCFYETAVPFMPFYLKGLLEGALPEIRHMDRYHAGYLTSAAVKGLVDSDSTTPLTADEVFGAMTVVPRKLAESFHRNGSDIDAIVRDVNKQYLAFKEGVEQINRQNDKLASAASKALARTVRDLLNKLDTLYSCNPVEDSFWGGQTADDRAGQLLVEKAAKLRADQTLKELPDVLVPRHQVQVLGLQPWEP